MIIDREDIDALTRWVKARRTRRRGNLRRVIHGSASERAGVTLPGAAP